MSTANLRRRHGLVRSENVSEGLGSGRRGSRRRERKPQARGGGSEMNRDF